MLEEFAKEEVKVEEPANVVNDPMEQVIDDMLEEFAKEEAKAEEPAVEEARIEDAPVEDGIDIFADVAEQVAAIDNEPNEIDSEVNATMFTNKLNTFNSMFKTNIDANNFIFSVTEAWKLMKMNDKQKQTEGQKLIGDVFKDTLKKAFDAEKELSYGEHRLPEFSEIVLSANELLRVSMFTFTDLYTDRKSASLFEPTAFGGVSAKDIANLTSGESLWSIDQRSDKAWEIQSASAKDIANNWLSENKPYEKMINEMNALIDKGKNGIAETNRKDVLNNLAAAEWLLLNNDKMMIDNPEDPLDRVPNWGNRYWKAITAAREALGIPKHISMRDLIQGDYAESSKAVNNPKYNETQIEEQVLDPDVREVYDSMEAQKSEFTIQRAGIVTSHPINENRINDIEMKEDRVPYPIPELDERKNLLEAPKENNFVIERVAETKIEMNKA